MTVADRDRSIEFRGLERAAEGKPRLELAAQDLIIEAGENRQGCELHIGLHPSLEGPVRGKLERWSAEAEPERHGDLEPRSRIGQATRQEADLELPFAEPAPDVHRGGRGVGEFGDVRPQIVDMQLEAAAEIVLRAVERQRGRGRAAEGGPAQL